MAQRNYTASAPTDKTKNCVGEGDPLYVSDNVSKEVIGAVKRLLGGEGDAGGFTKVYHFYRTIMSRTEGLFFQDIVRLTSLKKARYEEDTPNVRFYLCTKSFLTKSGMGWTYQEQRYNLTSLAKKGFITLSMRGFPSRRWVCIEWDVVARALLAAGDGTPDQWKHQLGTKSPDWKPDDCRTGSKPPVPPVGSPSCGLPHPTPCGLPHPRVVVNRTPVLRFTAPPTCGKPQRKEKKEGDDMIGDLIEEETLSRTAPAASPPPGDGTVSIFDPNPKPKAEERPTLPLAARDTPPLPSSASPPPSRKVRTPRDLSGLSNLELEELAIEDAERAERDDDGRKKRRRR
jgi:hypothetical protein